MVTDVARPARPSLLAGAARAWRALRWYVRGLTGEARYDAYLAHERSAHPDRTPMSQREFWRCVYRDQDANPGSRCC